MMSTKRIKVLESNNVSLIVPEIQDIDVWYKWVNDIWIQSYLWTVFWTVITIEKEKEYYENLNKNDKSVTFSIYLNNENIVIWNISLMNIDYKNKHSELWVAIFDKDYLNKWYWSEAIKLIMKYNFDILGMNKLYLKYVDSNARAWKVYLNLWFKEIWRLKEHNYAFWKFRDDVLMELLKKEYISIL